MKNTLKGFLFGFIGTLSLIAAVHNYTQYCIHFDNAMRLAAQIDAYGRYYEQNLANKTF